MRATLQAGAEIWIPCEVKPGPFSDERFVRVRDNGFDWVGFVQTSRLQDPILEGTTLIGALVLSVTGDRFTAQLPGEALNPALFEGSLTKVKPLGSVEA